MERKVKVKTNTYTPPYNETLITDFQKMMDSNFNFAKEINKKSFSEDLNSEDLAKSLDANQHKSYNNILAKLRKYKPYEIKELFAYFLIMRINKQLFEGFEDEKENN